VEKVVVRRGLGGGELDDGEADVERESEKGGKGRGINVG